MFIKPVMPVLEYIVNYDYIANVLCENKEKPELHCNGKCHLMKELAKAAEDEKPVSGKKSLHQEAEVLFVQPLYNFSLSTFTLPESNKVAILCNNNYSMLAETSFFHPPAVI
jgi:hypothetical protein